MLALPYLFVKNGQSEENDTRKGSYVEKTST